MDETSLKVTENDITIKQRNYNGDYGRGSVFEYNIGLSKNWISPFVFNGKYRGMEYLFLDVKIFVQIF